MTIGSNRPGTARIKRLSAAIAQIAAALYWPAAAAAPALPLPKPEAVLASLGVASYRVDGTRGIVDQTTDRAILNWKSFDIDTGYTMEFRQPSSTSIALNRINERAQPSRILGTLTANGQVYLYNPNGFVFGRSSRVDVNTLVASTLNITDEVFEKGIANAIDNGEPAFTGNGDVYRRNGPGGKYLLDAQGERVKVSALIEEGAVLNSNAVNGRILVLAPSIVNAGDLNAPQGQIILAAATDKVYLQAADASATGVRGLIVEVATGGDVTNLGKMVAARGNVTLAGFAVNQNGLVSATTSVDLNGSIVLKAAEGATVDIDAGTGAAHLYARSTAREAPNDDGLGEDRLGQLARVTLGAGSTTEVAPELDSKATAVDEQRQDPSRVDIVGHVVHMEGGASIKARGGKVSIAATDRPDDPLAATELAPTAGIQLDAGSVIDVSGSHASASVARNVVEVQLLSDELRDSPDQKGGPLFGKTIRVDVRTGTPLADISGAVARIQRGVAERTAAGGSIALRSNGAVDIEKGALLDTSGGVLDYQSDYVRTTRLLGADGRIYGIAEADPQRKYIGILGDVSKSYERWNVTKQWSVAPLFDKGRFENGYSEGKAGGELGIFAPRIGLDGELRGNTFDGARQRTSSERAAGATLRIDQSGFADVQDIVLADRQTAALLAELNSTLERVGQQLQPEGEEAPTASLVLVDTDLAKTGFRSIVLRTGREQAIAVTKDAVVELQQGGSLSIAAGSSTIDGHIGGVGAKVDVLANTGGLVLGETASIDVRGEWINDQFAPGSTAPYALDGGSVKLDARGPLQLSAGSVVDVGGGARLREDGKVDAGRAGTIDLRASGAEPASIELSGTLKGMALASGTSNNGGSLSVTANRVELAAVQPPEDSTALWLAPDFFQRGGFGEYLVVADRDGLVVRAGTSIAPQAANYVLKDDYRNTASTRALDAVATSMLLPAERRAAVDLTLAVEHTGVGADPASVLRTEAGSHIVADVGGSIALRSDSDLLLSGAIEAPAGTIDLRVTKPASKDLLGIELTDIGYRANQGIWLETGATLSATGLALHTPDVLGRKTGTLHDGGTVRMTAERGAIVLQEGSLVDVSGASGIYSETGLHNDNLGTTYRDTLRGSDGGSVVLTAADGALLNGELRAHGGAAPGTGGGTLALTVTPQLRNVATAATNPYPAAVSTIALHANREDGEAPIFGADLPLEGLGIARLGTAQIAAGGFAALDLAVDGSAPDSVIRFEGDVNLQLSKRLTLDTPNIAVDVPALAEPATESANSATLRAAYIALGSSSARTAPAPTGGSGKLRVEADLIDLVGGLATNGVGTLDLLSAGDIRLRGVAGIAASDLIGELKTSAEVLLQADQIYPATFSSYTVSVLDNPEGRITIAAKDTPHPVLTAAGSLTLNAPHIDQNGVLKAPFGTLALNAADTLTLGAGSITSVSAEGQIIPFGKTLSGLEWAYDLAGGSAGSNRPIQASAPAKRIALNGRSILVDDGATLDVSGGGDLQAHEFIRGPGGSADVLDPADTFYDADHPYVEKYALLPMLQGEFAPYDAGEFPASGLEAGDSVYLSAGSGVPAGVYALLPAHYALLPGAFLVTPQSDADVVPTTPTRAFNGAQVVAGYRLSAGTQIRDSSWSRFIVEPGSAARARSQYTVSRASEFFPAQAATRQRVALNLPADAGSVTLAAQTELSLRGAIVGDAGTTAANEPGRRGQLDIFANNIAIVAQRGAAGEGRVELLDSELNDLDVGSIFIGGTRSQSSGEEGVDTALNIGARSVEVLSGTTLIAPELLLAAQRRVVIDGGATLAAQDSGANGDGGGRLTVQGEAALVRVSGGAQVEIAHTSPTLGTAGLQVATGATLRSTGSINLDSTGTGVFEGVLDMQGGALQIGARRIALGGAGAGAGGIVLGTDLLAGLQVDTLALHSRSQIDLIGAFDLTFKELEVQAAGFNAKGTGVSVLRADAVTLANPDGARGIFDDGVERPLVLDSGRLTLGEGNFALRGFSASDLSARQGIQVEGSGRLLAGGDLTLRAPSIVAAAAADYGIAAQHENRFYDVRLLPLAASGEVPLAGLGGRLRIDGGRIEVGETDSMHTLSLAAPAGGIALRAHSGDVALARGVDIDVAGRQVLFADRLAFAAGGSVDIAADTGAVVVAEGARIDVSGAPAGGDAGSLSLAAPNGEVRLDGELAARAAAGAAGGRFALDVERIDSVAALSTRLASAGFDEAIELRQRVGDLLVGFGTELKAHAIRLVADLGQLRIDGTLQASGQRAGSVVLAGGDGVTLSSNAVVEARGIGVNERGGKVFIDSVGGAGAPGGGIDVQSGASIDVRGGLLQETTEISELGTIVYGIDGGVIEEDGVAYRAGDILLRAPRTADSLDMQVNGNWHGATRIDAEAVRIYELDPNSEIDAGTIAGYRSDTADYMSGIVAPDEHIALLPGIELRASESLTLNALWDLAAWRYEGEAGVLTLRSGGDLAIGANLTDALKKTGSRNTLFNNALQEGTSWSYRLIGGGDLASADVLATVATGNATIGTATPGSVALSNGAFVRTGTGFIDVAAAGDLTFADNRSAIYTVGRKLASNGELDRDNPYGTMGPFLGQPTRGFYAEFPVDGGDIAIEVGGDIIGATSSALADGSESHQFITDWWVKESSNLGYTGWGIAIDLPASMNTATSKTGGGRFDRILNARSGFRQGIGALAGGDIAIRAGGDLLDVSVAIPTTGKPISPRSEDGTTLISRAVLVNGGGNLAIAAGGDIAGGMIFVGAGSAELKAGGNIRGGSQYTSGTVFALGDTALAASAGGKLQVGAVFDPGLLTSVYATQPGSYFLTYGQRSAVELTSAGGGIELHNDVELLFANALRYTTGAVLPTPYLVTPAFLGMYPARVTAQALGGDIDVLHHFTLLPAANGTLNLLAAGDIQSGRLEGATVDINLADSDPTLFPSVLKPGSLIGKEGLLLIDDLLTGLSHAPTPVHTGDEEPARIIALDGDIRANNRLSIGLSKPALISAGRDIVDVDFALQNLDAADLTTIQAGRDIRYGIDFNPATGALNPIDKSIVLSGPGRFEFVAGRDIDLGASHGIVALGNLRNSVLPDAGASLGLYAGFNDADYTGFTAKYLQKSETYTTELLAYVAVQGSGATTKQEALEFFATLPQTRQRKLLTDIFFDELRAAGSESAKSGERGPLQRGLDAIAALFPTRDASTQTDSLAKSAAAGDSLAQTGRRGDVKLFLSRVATLAGGDIDILAPGGLVNAGLASSSLNSKSVAELGIVAQSVGDVNVFVKDGLQVNQSRVFALGGGSITAWSTDGDIDAGRGSKAALSAPPPIIGFDDRGNLRITYPPAVSGSGIRTAAPAGQTRGNVYLFTVNGSINLGEAGISGNDVYLVGPIIDPGGGLDFTTAVGAPTASVSLAPALASISSLDAGAAQAAVEQNAAPAPKPTLAATHLLTAQLLGFGDYSLGAIREGNFSEDTDAGRGGDSSANP